jgi:molecular chaperone GrpE
MNEEQKNDNQKSELDDLPAITQDELTEKLAASEKQRDEYLDGWKRAKADFINYKKDELRHLEDVAKYASTELVMDMIGILDNFDLGLRQLEKAGSVEKGIYIIRTQMEDILKRRGLERVSVKVGEPFDPKIAESIATAESDKPSGTILEEIEPGYKLHDKIIRPARVKVSKEK